MADLPDDQLSDAKTEELARAAYAILGDCRILAFIISPSGRVRVAGNVPSELVPGLVDFMSENISDHTEPLTFSVGHDA